MSWGKQMLKVALLTLALLMAAPAMAQEWNWENDQYSLSVDEETLIFGITIKEKNQCLTSARQDADAKLNTMWKDFIRSSVSIEYAEETANTTTRATLFSEGTTWNISGLEDGFQAQIDFAQAQIKLSFEVRLNEDGFTMTVPQGSIQEAGENLLCGVYLAPAFGATLLDERDGYLFVPEAAGAIINFSDGRTSIAAPYMKQVWGSNAGVLEPTAEAPEYPYTKDDEIILMPVYGFAYTDADIAALCVLDQGADHAQILAYAAGTVTPYNFVGVQYGIREKYFKLNSSTRGAMVNDLDMQDRTLSTRVYLLSGEMADYSGMAACYRQHLMKTEGLQLKPKDYMLRLNFLGAETSKGLLRNTVIPTTTIEQMSRILEAYDEAGVSDVLVCYQGWGKGGRTESYGSQPDALEAKLGTRDELHQLAEEVQNRGGKLLLEVDLFNANPEHTYSRRALARKINQKTIVSYTKHHAWPQLYALAPDYAEEMAERFMAWSGQKVDVSVAASPHMLFSYTTGGNDKHFRSDTVLQYSQTLKKLTEQKYLALDQPLSCYLRYADAYLNMPLETTGYSLITEAVPFLPMAIDGYVPYWSEELNLANSESAALLRLLEYGALPTYVLTAGDASKLRNTNADDLFSSDWEVYLPAIRWMNEELRTAWERIDQATMCHHERMTENLVCVTYTNGLKIYLNYGSQTITLDNGESVPAVGYLMQGGRES